MGDINDDGGGDIVGFGYMNTQVSLSTSTGNNSSFSSKYYIFQDYTKEQGWSDNSINPRMLVDVNGDGKKDIIGFDDKTYVSLSTSTSTTASFHSKVGVSIHFGLNKGWSDMDNYPRVMADVNGNGKADIIGFGYSGIQVSLSNSTQTNASFRPKQYVISSYCKTKGWSSNNTHPRMVVDVNGDGKGDIVGFGYNCVYVSLSNSTSTNASFLPKDQIYNEFTIDKGWSNNDKYPRMLADFNGDGKADIIGFGYNGTYVSLSTSTTTDASFGPITWVCPQFAYEQGWTSNEIYPRIVKDINCDNKADIIGFGQRVVKVSLSESGVSNVSFSNYQNVIDNYTEVKGWTSNNEYPRFLADIDNDGSYEIVGFGHNNVITFGFCEDCNH
jgi:hypothetical protein